MNHIDQLTLELLMNKSQYNKYVEKSDPKKYNEIKERQTKLEHFKPRILEVTRELFDNPQPQISLDVNELFSNYTQAVIAYLELKDMDKSSEMNFRKKEDEDVMFGRMDGELVLEDYDDAETEESPLKTRWSKDRVKKSGSSMLPQYPLFYRDNDNL
jgi:hypothetical protein